MTAAPGDGRVRDWRWWSGAAADLLRAATAASVVAAALRYPPAAVARFGVLLAVLLVPRRVGIPRPFDAAFCATLLLAAWAGVAQWYVTVPWMDEVVHCVATGAVAAVLYLALVLLGRLPGPREAPIADHRSSVPILTLSLGLAAGVIWEFYEWFGNRVLGHEIFVGYDDTILDLAMDGLGSLLAGLAVVRWGEAGLGPRRTPGSPGGAGVP